LAGESFEEFGECGLGNGVEFAAAPSDSGDDGGQG
jgi:hypothetical protein